MKVQFLFILLFSMLVLGCVRRHVATTPFGDHLYVEFFSVNPAGVEEAFLTDSINFRVYIGKYDTDHENFVCTIEGDSIAISKTRTTLTGQAVVDQTKLSRKYLTKNKVDSTKALFEFR